MNTPKNISRIHQFSSPATPLKRRSALNTSSVPHESFHNESVNDDEAERRTSRRIETDSGINLTEAADSLNNCLKLFAENKICKDNAWTLNIIDSFSKLIKRHHHALSNFQVAGSTLEASAKVYSLRVDSVYTDVLRMSADLSRQTAKALTKKNRLNLDDDESDKDENNEDKENVNANNQLDEAKEPKAKKAKKRRHVSTVTKNPETLNGRLDTHPLVDPFFAKLNSMVGDINSSQRLMQNIISTKDSNLKLQQNVKIWDSTEDTNVTIANDFDYSSDDVEFYQINSVSGSVGNTVIRTGLKHYRICDIPLENADEADVSMQVDNDDNFNMTLGRNASNIGLQFDINAAIEPIQNEQSFVLDFGDMNDNDFEDIDENEMVLLQRCKGLKHKPIVIEDMQPDTAVHLEYSYRPLDMIDQFWAGPSHWKFRQSRRTNRLTGISKDASSHLPANQNKRTKITKKKKLIKKSELSYDDIINIEDNDMIVPITKKTKGNQITLQVMVKRWDAKKLKLPTDYRISNDAFDTFAHASSIYIATNPDATFTNNDDESPYDYDNENDRNYCSRVDIQSDTETETNTDIGQMDNNMEFDNNVEMPPPPVPIDEIPDFYVGAPERIEKINIAFAKRAKVVDMKQLKQCSWSLISRKNITDPINHPHFLEVLNDLPKVLNKTMAENMSMPLAFYAILHLCNDKGMLLEQNSEDLKDFEISLVN